MNNAPAVYKNKDLIRCFNERLWDWNIEQTEY